MTIKTGAIKAGGSEVYPHTSLDQIRKSATSSTTLIAPGGVIQKDYLDLTGLLSTSYVSSANIIPASAINGLSTAVNNAASTYVHSSGVIPASAVVGLSAISATAGTIEEDGVTRFVSAGAGIAITDNSTAFPMRDVTVALKDYDTIETATTGATVTIAPGKAYIIDATTSSKTLAISSYNAGLWGRESHIELFVANTGYVHVGSNVTLVDALEPDAVNNLTVRFHDGHAIISVEDHVGAYMVNTTGTGSATSGTLAYGLKQTGNTYQFIGFRSELNTSSVPTGGATATVLKHIVGNGMDVGPTITGNLIVNAKATVRDVKLDSINLTGSATLTNVFVGNGGVSGGIVSLGGILDLTGNTNAIPLSCGGTSGLLLTDTSMTIYPSAGSASAVVISGYRNQINTKFTAITNGGHIVIPKDVYQYGNIYGSNLVFEGGGFRLYDNTVPKTYSGLTLSGCSGPVFSTFTVAGQTLRFESCTFINTSNATTSGCIYTGGSATALGSATFSDCVLDGSIRAVRGIDTFEGSNTFYGVSGTSNSVCISSGAVINLVNVISGAITVSTGGCVVNGATIAAGAYKKITSVGGSASGTLA